MDIAEISLLCPKDKPLLCGLNSKFIGYCRENVEDCNKKIKDNSLSGIVDETEMQKYLIPRMIMSHMVYSKKSVGTLILDWNMGGNIYDIEFIKFRCLCFVKLLERILAMYLKDDYIVILKNIDRQTIKFIRRNEYFQNKNFKNKRKTKKIKCYHNIYFFIIYNNIDSFVYESINGYISNTHIIKINNKNNTVISTFIQATAQFNENHWYHYVRLTFEQLKLIYLNLIDSKNNIVLFYDINKWHTLESKKLLIKIFNNEKMVFYENIVNDIKNTFLNKNINPEFDTLCVSTNPKTSFNFIGYDPYIVNGIENAIESHISPYYCSQIYISMP